MSDSHRTHRRRRRKKSSAGRVGLLGALVGVLGIVAVSAGIVILRQGAGGAGDEPSAASSGGPTRQGGDAVAAVQPPATGQPLSVNTPEGDGYALGAARAGTGGRPQPAGTPPPAGGTYAYVDYVLTNSRQRSAPLEFPADLFVRRDMVAGSARQRCMPQPGVPDDMCTLPNHSRVTGALRGSGAPFSQDGDTMMPGGASYLVRVATDLPVKKARTPDDIRLYVWNARFTADRKGIQVPLPDNA